MLRFSSSTIRLATGLLQGIVLYLLWLAHQYNVWPAIEATYFVPATVIVVFVPVLIMINIGTMRPKTLLAWSLAASGILALLCLHDVVRRNPIGDQYGVFWASYKHLSPTTVLLFWSGAAIFIGQCLIVAADAEQRLIASYCRYFDTAWKLAIQLLFSVFFTGAFWLILLLGISLFELIQSTFLKELIQHRWFSMPLTTLTFSYAIYLTDVKANMLRGIRTLGLTLLSWLLPILTLLVAIFLISIPFKGLDIIWSTRHTSQIMLSVAGILVILINAVYHDGSEEHKPSNFLRFVCSVAAISLLITVAIAACAFSIRVNAFGLTINMVVVAACLIVAMCYAIGYAWAVIPSSVGWLRRVEKTNIYTSFLVIAVLLALLSPLADPARLAVASQLARLESGKSTMNKFDFHYLRWEGEIYGYMALNELKQRNFGAETALVQDRIGKTLSEEHRWSRYQVTESFSPVITVYPVGQHLPDSFTQKNWRLIENYYGLPSCLTDKNAKCKAYILNTTDKASQQILLSDGKSPARLFKQVDGYWTSNDVLMPNGDNCWKIFEAAFASENIKLVSNMEPQIEINGVKLQIKQNARCENASTSNKN